jgi:guanine deaminase
MRNSIVIYLNGIRLAITGDAVFSSLVEFLRARGMVGTKIGCAEGDCGACTVLAGTPEAGTIRYRTIASCIQALYQLDGTHIITVEASNKRTRSMSATKPEPDLMALAIAKARDGIAAGQSSIGEIIVHEGTVVAPTHNTVWRDTDPSAHAEVNCIRAAASALKLIDLSGCKMYSTSEPCPICLSAIHWSRLVRVVFGASIADAALAGFNELQVDAKILAAIGKSALKVEGGLLHEECALLIDLWKKTGLCGSY